MLRNLPANAGDIRDTGSILGLGISPGGGHDNPLQYSCLEKPMDRGAWRAAFHRVTKSWTWLIKTEHTHEKIHHIWLPYSLINVQQFTFYTKYKLTLFFLDKPILFFLISQFLILVFINIQVSYLIWSKKSAKSTKELAGRKSWKPKSSLPFFWRLFL